MARKKVEYLGFEVSGEGIKPAMHKVEAILNIPRSNTIKQTRSYTSALLYRKAHIPDLARILLPLYKLTRKGIKFIWTNEHQEAFEKSKQLLANRTLLSFPDEKSELILTIDAHGAGVCLSQIQDGVEGPISFTRKKFAETKRSLPSYRQELMGLIYAINTFRNTLLLRKFRVRRDSRALVYLRTAKKLSPVLHRCSIQLEEFNFTLEHLAGHKNCLANLISRVDYTKNPPIFAEDEKEEKP